MNRLFQMEALRITPLFIWLDFGVTFTKAASTFLTTHIPQNKPQEFLEVAGIRFLYSHTQYRRLG